MRFSSTALMATLVCLLSSYASAHTISRPAGNSLIQSNIKYRNIEAVVEGTGDLKPEPRSLVDDDCDEAASVEEDCDEDNEGDDIAVQDDCEVDENNDDDETDDCDKNDTTPAPISPATIASAHAGPKTAQATKTATPAATSTGPSQQNLAQAPQPFPSVASESQHADCETVSHWHGSANSEIRTVYITVTETALNTAMLAAKPTGISFTNLTSSPAKPQPSPTPVVPSREDDGADDDEIPFCDEETDTAAIASLAAQGPTTSAASPAKTTAGEAAKGQEAAVEDNESECDDEADEEASQDDEECDEDSSSDQAEVDDCEEDGEPTPASMNSNLYASPQQGDGANAHSTIGADFKSHDNTASQSTSITSVSASRPSLAVASDTAANAMLAEQDPVDGRDGMTTVTGAVPAIVTASDAVRRRRARHWVG